MEERGEGRKEGTDISKDIECDKREVGYVMEEYRLVMMTTLTETCKMGNTMRWEQKRGHVK